MSRIVPHGESAHPRRARENWVPLPPPIAPEKAGVVAIAPAGPFEAGSLQVITLVYTAGHYGIDDTGALRVCFRFATDQGTPQFTDPAAENYVSVVASNGAVLDVRFDYKLNTRPWDRTIVVKVARGYLRSGDTITLRFGDPAGGSPGFRLQTFTDPFHQFQVLVDPIACGHYVRVPNQPTFAIVGGAPAAWTAVLPTRREPGADFSLGIRVDDRWGNPTDAGGRSVRLEATGAVRGLPETVTIAAGQAAIRIDGLTADAPCVIEIEASEVGGPGLARSNPLVVAAADGLQRIWGDLHAQSAETIGSASAHDYLSFARDLAFLDVVGHQGNDFQITPEFWRELNDLMIDFDERGRFVTIYGYEWSGNTALGGDRNVFFREPHRPIRRSSHALVADRGDLASDCEDAAELFRSLNRDGEDAVCWAHCGGRYADIAYAHDVRLERSVEVHSSWGTFEWLLADAFAGGHRVGIVANSDGHKGRPGSEPPGASMFGALGGLTCFLAESFDQDGVFEAMKARHHYATTGCRLDLSVQAALPQPGMLYRDDPSLPEASARPASRAIMGDIIRSNAGTLHLGVEVAAASPILLLEIRNGMQTIETIRPYEDTSPGRRLFLFWSGAEYRGRGRQTVWDGMLKISDNEILSARPINFFNPDKQLEFTADSVSWRSVTTGNFAGCELQLASAAGRIVMETPHGGVDAEIAALGFEPLTVDCGGLERRLSLMRLPDRNPHRSLRIDRDIALEPGSEHALMVAVTLEDGHRAWSSPIYLLR